MSNTISNLLIRNLRDVFGENDPARRRAAIDEIWAEDGVFYDPKSGAHRGRDEIDRVAAPVGAAVGIVEHAIFGPELVDGRAPARGVAFTEDVAKIAGQQGRYTVGHRLSPFGINCLGAWQDHNACVLRSVS